MDRTSLIVQQNCPQPSPPLAQGCRVGIRNTKTPSTTVPLCIIHAGLSPGPSPFGELTVGLISDFVRPFGLLARGLPSPGGAKRQCACATIFVSHTGRRRVATRITRTPNANENAYVVNAYAPHRDLSSNEANLVGDYCGIDTMSDAARKARIGNCSALSKSVSSNK